MAKEQKAKWMLCASMVIFGTLGPFVRHIPVSSGELALYRAVMAAVLIGGYLLVSKQRIRFSRIRRSLLLLSLSGIAMGINWIMLFEAYKYTTVSVATLSYYFAPVIVTAVCPILFREKLTGKQVICFLMSTVGLIMITGIGDTSGGGKDFIGILFGISAAVFYASVILLNKFIKDVEDLHRTLLQFIAAIAVLRPYVALSGGITLGGMEIVGWVNLLIVGLVHTGIAYVLYFSSVKEMTGQKAAILSYIDPLVAVAVSVTVLGEKMTLWQGLGGLLILGFTLFNEIEVSKKT